MHRAAIFLLALVAARAEIVTQLDVRIPMRDRVQLAANIFRPSAAGRWPVLLVRTPYGKGSSLTANYRPYVDHGYALVIQDVRGRHSSEGAFQPLTQEGPDGEDTLNWIGRQPWCDGKIGMFGGSYLGIVQWQAALANSPYLKAIFPVVSGYDDYLDRYYSRGGAMKWAHRLLWISENLAPPGFPRPSLAQLVHHLPPRTADRAAAGQAVDWYQRVLDHPEYDAFWRSLSTREQLEKIQVPVFAAGGWFDNYGESDLEAFAALRKLGRNAHLVVGPWSHGFDQRLRVDFGPEATLPLRDLHFLWFDYWLKGQGSISHLAPLKLFTMGANRWESFDAWPPRDATTLALYLGSKRSANTGSGDGALQLRPARRKAADTYSYDPRKPVPTLGGAICCNPTLLPPGPFDQAPVESRPDVLVYTGAPLGEDLQVTGPVRVHLYIATTARDTDFAAKLVDVDEHDRPVSITDGILRLRYRNGLDRAELAKPGETYSITIPTGPTSHVFRAGHRVRLEVSSSNFPRFDRNLNTGGVNADATEPVVATQTVRHGATHPSALLLPVVGSTGGVRNERHILVPGRKNLVP